ncbi:MAG: L-ascorbate metabolism protein UlaG (beta-lactamase superfamily) [Marivirga sp.]|jgi:L-ascorbate metabolism protein UlaG (beta-lactamase superfamily)
MLVLKYIFKGLLFIVVISVLGYYMVKYFQPSIGRAPETTLMEGSPYYKDGQFHNIVPTRSADLTQMPSILMSYLNREEESAPTPDYLFTETNQLQLKQDTAGTVYYNWLGHAAILMQKEGKYILLDPMLGERASPFSFFGPKRYSKSPISTEELPELEAVIFSHDHYDHLDYPTILKLIDKTKFFYVPLGVKSSLVHWGVPEEKIRECSWWDQKDQDFDITITATPARHFSGRLFSPNNTFWASWVVKWGDEHVYFGGDTGIFDGFAEIDEKLGPFDMAFMPIGAYNPAWHDIHMDPEEAINAFQQMRATKFFPIHWGTFDLALHSWYEPINDLIELSELNEIPLISLPQGEWFHKDVDNNDAFWWKKYSEELKNE